MSLIERVLAALTWPDAALSWDLDDPVPGPRFAVDLEALGDAVAAQGAGDRPVSVQVPGSPAAVALHMACLASGTLVQHMPVSFGAREVAPILDAVRPALLVTTRADVAGDPAVQSACGRVLVVADADLAHVPALVERLVDGRSIERLPLSVRARAVDDRRPALLLPTSGTTGASKVVVHSQRSLEAATDLTARALGMQRSDVFFCPSPPTHITGLLLGIYLPLLHGAGTAFQGRWDGDLGLRIIQARRCTVSSAPPTFVLDLHAAWMKRAGGFLQRYMIGGADVPTARITQIEADTGCLFVRSYGGTEAPMLTLGSPLDAPDVRLGADGRVLPAVEMRTATDPIGELFVRAPQQAMGYWWRGEIRSCATDDGWVTLGDEGSIEDGVVRMAGRLKDVIVRGGVKFYVPELDAVLKQLPGVHDAAVFPVEDERFGQVPAVAVVPAEGVVAPTVQELADALTSRSLGHQKHPVAVLDIDEVPRTPTGKIDRRALAALYDKTRGAGR